MKNWGEEDEEEKNGYRSNNGQQNMQIVLTTFLSASTTIEVASLLGHL